ncbi:MAG TPA: tetratricopeptide repeat protein [Nevskiaceae bacterium]
MSDAYGDSEELEALRHWWSENWKTLVAGVVIGLIGVGVWQGWTRYQAAHRMAAANLYADFQHALTQDKGAGAPAVAQKLTADYGGTPYASVASLKLAQEDVSKSQYAAAAERLQWVADHGDDAGLRSVARLRLAAVLWQEGKDMDALAKLAHPPKNFTGLYAELRGDIQASRGDKAAARSAYEEALAALPQDSAERTTVQAKLSGIAVAPPTAAASVAVKP